MKDIECKHHKNCDNGYHYALVGQTLWLCNRCEKKLRIEITEQINIEEFRRTKKK